VQNMPIGLAWLTLDDKGRRVHWHNGGTGGFGSFVGFMPDEGIGLVALTATTHPRDFDHAGILALRDLANLRSPTQVE
jgi:CubicO group peptidase (beta-lactamase class C family)